MKLGITLLIGSTAAFSMQCASRSAAVQTRARPVVASSPIVDVLPGRAARVEGNTLKTWDLKGEETERVQLELKSPGRPIHTNIELWHTPSYVPTKFSCYSEDGALRPVTAVIETPKHPKTVACYNTGSLEFPFEANVANTGKGKAQYSLAGIPGEKVQGGKVTAFEFGPEVQSVQILLHTVDVGERNMKARIELTQGPNQVKQLFDIYASKGYQNPFYVVIQTPGMNKAIRIINQNTVEFPLDAWVLPYETKEAEAVTVVGGF